MKHILYLITQTHYGGAQKYVHDLALSLHNTPDYRITVAIGEGEEQDWMKELVAAGMTVHRLNHVKRNLSPWHDFLSGFELFKLYRQTKPDVIHLNSSKIGATGAVIGWLYRIITGHRSVKVVYTVHGLILNEPLALWRKVYYWFAEWFGALFKDTIICVSYHDKKSVLKWHIAPERKLDVVHNGVDFDQLEFLDASEARRQLSTLSGHTLPDSHQVIGTIAGLYKTKGLNYFIESLSSLITTYKKPITALIIGDGPEKQYLTTLIARHNLQDTISIIPIPYNASRYLKACNVFVLSSVKEGLPYTLIEARAAGIPIITTDTGGTTEVITHEHTGLVVPPRDTTALTDALANVLSTPALQATLSSNTQQDINHFSLQTMVEHTTKHYAAQK